MYERVSNLPLEIDEVELERLEQPVSTEFTRVTTIVRLRGGGEEGLGEDVTYEAALHGAWPALDLLGSWTLDVLSEHVGSLDLFATETQQRAYADYRRWSLESAALDLALRQAGMPLAGALGRQLQPVRFVVSTRGDWRAWLRVQPSIRFKLDAEKTWDDELIRELAATGAVDVVDLKGFYRGTPVDLLPDADLYRRVVEGFPDAWIEDAAITDETRPVLEPHRDRLTWDAPIHSVDDVLALEFPPKMLNVKPSRFGSVRRLFDTFDYCAARGIGTYSGGQFELGPGRGQIQYVASLFSPDGPNDVAPGIYNVSDPRPGLPESPLPVAASPTGFRWGQ
jgi:hypothetical protein